MPTDVTEAIAAVVAAVDAGRVDPGRIRASARRVLETKARAGLHRGRMVDLDAVDDVVGSAAHLAFADTAAARSMTLLRDRAGAVPVDSTVTRRILRRDLCSSRQPGGRHGLRSGSGRQGRVAAPGSDRPGTPGRDVRLPAPPAQDVDLVLVSAYVPPRAGAGEVAAPDALADFIREVGQERPLLVTSFGNPYLLVALPDAPAYLIAGETGGVAGGCGPRPLRRDGHRRPAAHIHPALPYRRGRAHQGRRRRQRSYADPVLRRPSRLARPPSPCRSQSSRQTPVPPG